jgi:patatin-like phospholipase/acyl hydrolase
MRRNRMKPFRKHVTIAIDGEGIKGVMVTRALADLEDYMGKQVGDVFRLAVVTSIGSHEIRR